MFAADKGYKEIVEVLLTAGAELNIQDSVSYIYPYITFFFKIGGMEV
jgi:hypothetical protein